MIQKNVVLKSEFKKDFRWMSGFLLNNDLNCKVEFLSLPYIHPQPPSAKWSVLWPSGVVCSQRPLWSLVLFSSHLWHSLLVVLTRQIDIRGLFPQGLHSSFSLQLVRTHSHWPLWKSPVYLEYLMPTWQGQPMHFTYAVVMDLF